MLFFNKNKILITHNGAFHADDLFASATLFILNKGNVKIIRTRNPEIIKKGDYVYDVGGRYDEERHLFDHHQKGGAGSRSNGIPYSSFGLIWKIYGKQICGDEEVAIKIDQKIVQPIDAVDNGVDIIIPKFNGINPYSAQSIFLAYYPTWKEAVTNLDKIFKREVKKIIKLLSREIEIALADVEGERIIIDAYNKAGDKKIIILNNRLPRYLIQDVLATLSEPIYFIYPNGYNNSWKVEAVRKDLTTHKSRKLFPESWRGLMNDNELIEVTGIKDIIFCHQSGFLLNVKSKEGALKLARKALLA